MQPRQWTPRRLFSASQLSISTHTALRLPVGKRGAVRIAVCQHRFRSSYCDSSAIGRPIGGRIRRDDTGQCLALAGADPVEKTLLGTVDLVGLGLTPVDTLALSTDFLSDLARHMLGQPNAYIEAPRQHALAQQIVATLGSRPAAGRDLIADGMIEGPIRDELGRRYQRLRKAAHQLRPGSRIRPRWLSVAWRLRRGWCGA